MRLVYTPKPSSWLNQVESWCSILVRRLLKWASFSFPSCSPYASATLHEIFQLTLGWATLRTAVETS
jgi:transposase